MDTPDGRAALDWAVRIATHLDAALVLLSVVPDTRVIPGLGEARVFSEAQRDDYAVSLDAAVGYAATSMPDGASVEGRLLPGPVVDALADLSFDDCDLLVVGSRGYGPVRRVLLGGVSSRVVRHSRLPVVVAPRGE